MNMPRGRLMLIANAPSELLHYYSIGAGSGKLQAPLESLDRLVRLVHLKIVVRDVVIEIECIGVQAESLLIRLDRLLMPPHIFEDLTEIVVERPVVGGHRKC